MKKKTIQGKLSLNKKVIAELRQPEQVNGGWHTSACNTEVSCVSDCLCPVSQMRCATEFTDGGCSYVHTIDNPACRVTRVDICSVTTP